MAFGSHHFSGVPADDDAKTVVPGPPADENEIYFAVSPDNIGRIYRHQRIVQEQTPPPNSGVDPMLSMLPMDNRDYLGNINGAAETNTALGSSSPQATSSPPSPPTTTYSLLAVSATIMAFTCASNSPSPHAWSGTRCSTCPADAGICFVSGMPRARSGNL